MWQQMREEVLKTWTVPIGTPVDAKAYLADAGERYVASMHVPLPPEAVRDAMPLFFELMAQESEPAVQAVLGHFVFVFIHPYMDGNGRLARFILNAALARGGWPWTVVTRESRHRYMAALEAASAHQDIKPFAKVISQLLAEQMAHPLKRPS
jgi:Fic family protein